MKKALLPTLCMMLCYGIVAIQGFGQKPGTPVVTPLKVTIQNFDSTGTFPRIRSDCWNAAVPNCPYVDGLEGVSASFDKSGNLQVDCQSSKTQIRQVYFDYGNPNTGDPSQVFMPPPPGSHVPPYPTGFQNMARVVTDPPVNAPFTPLQNLSIGAVQCVGLAVTFQLNGTGWRSNFRKGNNFPNTPLASYGVVTRLDANTWEVEPRASSCNPGTATVGELNDIPLSGPGSLTNNGMYYLPVKITLVRK